MSDAASTPPATNQVAWAPLVDATDIPVAELTGAGDTALARSVRRLVKSLDDPDGTISAFQSFVP